MRGRDTRPGAVRLARLSFLHRCDQRYAELLSAQRELSQALSLEQSGSKSARLLLILRLLPSQFDASSLPSPRSLKPFLVPASTTAAASSAAQAQALPANALDAGDEKRTAEMLEKIRAGARVRDWDGELSERETASCWLPLVLVLPLLSLLLLVLLLLTTLAACAQTISRTRRSTGSRPSLARRSHRPHKQGNLGGGGVDDESTGSRAGTM